MRVKITIETWNDEWRLEIEDEDDGETLNAGYYPTFEQCMSECKRYLSQLSAAEQSVQRTCAQCGADDWRDAVIPDTVEICNHCGASR